MHYLLLINLGSKRKQLYYEYDIAISYKSEIEKKAARLNDFLTEDGWRVFFAPVRQQELLSEKIHQMLYGIYKNKSLMKILLISDSYLEGEWTGLEKRVSLQSTKIDRKRLLIVNYTDQLILPGELQALQYLDGHKYTEDQIAALVTERMKNFVLKNMINGLDQNTKDDVEKAPRNQSGNVVVNNHGIITGDGARFDNIFF